MENESLVNPPPVAPEITPEPVLVTQPVKKSSGFKNIALLALALVMLIGGSVGIYFQLAPKSIPAPAQVQPPPQMEKKAELSLSLMNPEINTVTDSGKLNVTGVTSPDTSVVLMTENHDSIVKSDEKGNFEGEIDLEDGVNSLSVTAINDDGEEKSLTREVVFDDQVLGQQTESGKKLALETGKRKKFVEDSLESVMRNNSLDKNIRYVDEKNKLVRSNTIKPKDRIIAVLEDNDATGTGRLKKAVKIFTRSATASGELRISKRRAVQGVVTNITGSVIELAHQIQRNRLYRVIFDAKTVFTATSSANLTSSVIQVGERIIAVGTATGSGDILATRIRIIPGKATGIFTKKPVTPFPTLSSTPSATPAVTASPTPSPTVTPSPTPSPTLTPTPTP